MSLLALICLELGYKRRTLTVTRLSVTPHSKFLRFSTEPRYSEDVPQPGPQTVARLLQGLLAAQGAPVTAVPEAPPAVLR